MRNVAQALVWALPLVSSAATLRIENAALAAQYDEGEVSFTLQEKETGRAFVSAGRLDGAGGLAAVEEAADPVFGIGRRIVVTQADGSVATLSLFQNLPFLLIRKEQKNSGAVKEDLQKVAPVSFALDLDRPAAELKTMGTGGLLPADQNPGSYLFLAVADPATRSGAVVGWLTQDRGSGTVFSGIKNGKVEVKAQLEHGHLLLPPGQSAKLDTLAIGFFSDARLGLEQFADAVKRQYDIRLRPPVATYCSWYAEGPDHGGAGTEATTIELSKFIARELKPFGLGVIQIDSGWQDGPPIGGFSTEFVRASPNGPYRNGFDSVARQLTEDGMTLGLWWLPFGRYHLAPEYKDRQHWFVKKPDGTPLRQHSFGGTCLDCTHPEVQEHLRTLARSMRAWGVTYYKMDGLSSGAGVDHVYINDGYKDDRLSDCLPLHDPSKSNIEAMRLGLKIIREGAGDGVFFSGCCAVQNMRIYAGAIGLVDSMRVGPDFNHDGQGIRSGPLRGSRMYFMNGRIWWNDPDPSKVRTSSEGCVADSSINGAVTLDQARLTTSWVSLAGQFFLLSDWLPNLPPERLEVLRRTLAHHSAIARPVDYFDNALANTWLVTDERPGLRRDVIGLFNFHGEPLKVGHTCARLGLDPARPYHAFDFWANTPLPDFKGEFQSTVAPGSCRVIAVRAEEGRPVLLSTSRHVTQGIIDVAEENWSGTTLSGTSEVIANDPYELRIRVPAGWKLDRAGAPATETPGLVRMALRSPVTARVKWEVSFAKVTEPAPLAVAGLKAEMKEAGDPVTLMWTGSAPFYEISRDGVVIATGHYGLSYTDETAPPGKACAYVVQVLDGEARAAASLTTRAFDPGPVPPLPTVSLAALKPESVRVGWGSMQTGKEVGGAPLKLDGRTYADGIGLHAEGEAVYACRPEWKRFVAVVGIDDSQRHDPRASIVSKVVAEDAAGKQVVLARTPVLRTGKVMQWHFNVALPAACAKLRLVVEDAGDGYFCDHADWADAGFMLSP
jgi:hypothetical protein